VVAEVQRHRRVVPQHVGTHTFSRNQLVEELPLDLGAAAAIGVSQMRDDDVDLRLRLGNREMRPIGGIEQRFFNEEHATMPRAAAE
jgi:hypothetical protein